MISESVRELLTKNQSAMKVQSEIADLEGRFLTSHCVVISDVMSVKSTFSGIIRDALSISVVKMNLYDIFKNFVNIGHFCAHVVSKPEGEPEVEF